MAIQIVYETHSTSVDNERGIASGWNDCLLSELGRQQARELGGRRRDDGITAVFSSDLRRAAETAAIGFEGTGMRILHDRRLRECDYGELNGSPASALRAQLRERLESRYPGGESWAEAVSRVGRFMYDLPMRRESTRILVIGHMATRWAFEHLLNGVPLEDLAAEAFVWQEGWEYRLEHAGRRAP